MPFASADGTEVTNLDLNLPGYQLLNLAVGFDTGDYTVEMFVNNATDENALLSFDRERGGRARLAHRVGNPRTIGWRVNMNF